MVPQQIEQVVQQSNSIIYDIAEALKFSRSAGADGVAYYTRVFDFCLPQHFTPISFGLDISALRSQRGAIGFLNSTNEQGFDFDLEKIDRSKYLDRLDKRKIKEVVKFFLTIDSLTGRSYFDIILSALGEKINPKNKYLLVGGYLFSYLSLLQIEETKIHDDFYFSRLVNLASKEFQSEKSEFSQATIKEVREAELLSLRKRINLKFSGESPVAGTLLQRLNDFLSQKLKRINDKTPNKNHALDGVLNAIHHLLFSAADPNLPQEQQKFFIQALLDEQLGMDSPEATYKFYSQYQNEAFSIIMDEVFKRFLQCFKLTNPTHLADLKNNFIKIISQKDVEKVTHLRNDLYRLSNDINDVESNLEGLNNESTGLQAALVMHFHQVREEYDIALDANRPVSPHETTQLLQITLQAQKTFVDENNKAYQEIPQTKKSIIAKLFETIMKRLSAIFTKHSGMKSTEEKTNHSRHKVILASRQNNQASGMEQVLGKKKTQEFKSAGEDILVKHSHLFKSPT